MKLSELITRLMALRTEHGDIEVAHACPYEGNFVVDEVVHRAARVNPYPERECVLIRGDERDVDETPKEG